MPTAYSLLLALAQGVFWVSLIHTASGRAYVNNPSEHAHSTVAAKAKGDGKHIVVPRALAEKLELPEGHPSLWEDKTNAAGLPEGCITYAERYDKYRRFEKDHVRGWNPNEELPDADIAVLLRVHHNLAWHEDLRLMLRALMVESRRAGLHFWVLHQNTIGASPPEHAKPTDFALDCPEEFRPILQTFSAKQLHDAYPLLHIYDDPHARDYLVPLYYLRRYSGYRFAWILEYDLRYTGNDWGRFLNAMLNLGVDSLAGKEPHSEYTSDLGLPPDPDAQLPDFVLQADVEIGYSMPLTEQLMPRDAEHWHFANLFKSNFNLFGISRRYIDSLHGHSVEGNGGYVEDFLLTLAIEERLDVVSMPLAMWEGESIHCCTDFGPRYYEDWFLSGECRSAAVIHPMKNSNQTIWGQPQTWFSG